MSQVPVAVPIVTEITEVVATVPVTVQILLRSLPLQLCFVPPPEMELA